MMGFQGLIISWKRLIVSFVACSLPQGNGPGLGTWEGGVT